MIIYRISRWIVSFLVITFVSGLFTSCKNKPELTSSDYIKELRDIAVKYNTKCPMDEPNGTKLESVTFTDKTMTFRLSVSDEAIVTINLEETRDSLVKNMSNKLKKFLIRGNCNLEYKYISPNDSSSITIIPNELK